MAVTWRKGSDYPDVESLAEAFKEKRTELTKDLFKYWAVIVLLTVVVFVLAFNPYTIALGAVCMVIAFIYVAMRRRGFTKMAEIVTDENFYWAAGKAQNKWKRGVIDFAAANAYQVGMWDEWIECDYSTYNYCEVGKDMVLVKKSLEPTECAYGIMIPEGGAHKQVKKIARTAPNS